MDARIHDDQNPDSRPATTSEIEDLLADMTAADGTPYLDILRDAQAAETT